MKKTILLLPLVSLGLFACTPGEASSPPASTETTSSQGSGSSSSSAATSSSPSSLDGESSASSSSSSASNAGSSLLDPDTVYDEGDELAQAAVASLARRSHTAHIDFQSYVYRKSADELGIYSGRVYDIAYDYDGGEVAYSEASELSYADIKLEEVIEDSAYTVSSARAYYFKDPEDGTITREALTVDNQVQRVTMADYDENTGMYTPYAFEEMYKNPWDYIRPSDLTPDGEGNLVLSNEKANFLVDCYKGTATNWVKKCTVMVEGGEVRELLFEFDDLVDERYTRTSTASVAYARHGEKTVSHLTPFENENPELAAAFARTANMRNFTYKKSFDETSPYGIGGFTTAYYTEDVAFYNANDFALGPDYAGGNEENYKAVKEGDGLYHVYCYVYSDGDGWHWEPVTISTTATYVIDDFAGLGPRMYEVNPALFRKTGEYTYEAEKAIVPVLGTYFDNQMQGCSSAALETNTTEVKITLSEDGNISRIETGFTVLGVEQRISFELYDIGTTVVPDYAI